MRRRWGKPWMRTRPFPAQFCRPRADHFCGATRSRATNFSYGPRVMGDGPSRPSAGIITTGSTQLTSSASGSSASFQGSWRPAGCLNGRRSLSTSRCEMCDARFLTSGTATGRESQAPQEEQSRRRGSKMSETRGVLLPAYVLADESGSMSPYLEELSNGLVSLCEGLRAEPMVAAKLRLAVLGFSDDVQVRLAVADMRTESTLPQVRIRGLTSYKAVFEDLLHRFPADVQWLRGEGYKAHRPVVFLLSDGQPTDGGSWRGPHAA